MEMTKIFITGTTTHADNRGVSAMASSTIKIIKKYVPNSKITMWHTFPESYNRLSPTTYETDVTIGARFIPMVVRRCIYK